MNSDETRPKGASPASSPVNTNKRSREVGRSEGSPPATSTYGQDGVRRSPRKRPGAAQIQLDEHRLRQRQKQIDYGKNTVGYDKYLEEVPIGSRQPHDPVTPEKSAPVSKRHFDGLIRSWRRKLHKYDPPGTGEGKDVFDVSFDDDGATDADTSITKDDGPIADDIYAE